MKCASHGFDHAPATCRVIVHVLMVFRADIWRLSHSENPTSELRLPAPSLLPWEGGPVPAREVRGWELDSLAPLGSFLQKSALTAR